MRLKGKIIKWNTAKAFVFIAPNGGGNAVFIHKKALVNQHRPPKINDVISFSIIEDNQGRYYADQVIFSGEKLKKKQANSRSKSSIYLALIFISCLISAHFLGYLPQKVLLVYLGVSFITFIAYAYDKSKAQQGKWRTKESTLHLLALLGGWPGAALAQQMFRHKSKKVQFRAAFWFTILINTAALAWLMSTHGQPLLRLFF